MAEVKVRYNYRLRVGADQAQALQSVFDSCRFVYNQALGRWRDLWRYEQLGYSGVDADAELTDWRGRLDWLAAQPSVPQQQVLRDLFGGVAAFFDRSNPAGRPRFKKHKAGYATARWTRRGFKVSGNGLGAAGDRLEVAVAGGRIPLRVVWSRPLPAEPSSVTVYRDPAGRWWASFVVAATVPDTPVAPTGRVSGVDVGLATFATTEHPATDIANPRYARRAAKALARSQRNLARKRPGSNNRGKARQSKARVEAATAAQRHHFHHQAARALVADYDRIGVEKLAVKNLSRRGRGRTKTGLNRSIADAGWSAFIEILWWQATKAGKTVIKLPAAGSTQCCSACGAKAKPRLELSDRVFKCWQCSLVLGRDRNAARNLNPDRPGPSGGTEPPGEYPEGDDGHKTRLPARNQAA